MERELFKLAMRDAIARAGSREAGAWMALREQDLLAIEGFMDADMTWFLGLRETASLRSPLAWSAFLHKHDALRALLALEADPAINRVADPNEACGGSPILVGATRSRCVDCMQALIEAGASLNAEDAQGVTPLVAAVGIALPVHAIRCAKVLLDAGADPNKVSSAGYFALAGAAQKNCAAQVDQLMDAQAEVDLEGGDGFTALFYAIENGAVDAAGALLRAGADYEARALARDQAGEERLMTPLELARAKGDTEAAGLLFSFAEAAALRERIRAGAPHSVRAIGRSKVRL